MNKVKLIIGIICLGAITLSSSCKIQHKEECRNDLELWYEAPAKVWEESLPLGNGRLGAMPTGGVYNENIVLNDITMWSGSVQNTDNPEAKKQLVRIRKLLLKGQNKEAQDLMYSSFCCSGKGSAFAKGANEPFGSYQILGNLKLTYKLPKDSIKNYRRGLILENATAYTNFTIDHTEYSRKYFVSHTEDVIIIELSSDKKKQNRIYRFTQPSRTGKNIHRKQLSFDGGNAEQWSEKRRWNTLQNKSASYS